MACDAKGQTDLGRKRFDETLAGFPEEIRGDKWKTVMYYKANTLLKANRRDEAKKALYEIYEIDGAGTGERWCDVVEVIEAESWEAWQAVNERPEMKEAVEQFFQIAKRGTVQVIHGRKVGPK